MKNLRINNNLKNFKKIHFCWFISLRSMSMWSIFRPCRVWIFCDHGVNFLKYSAYRKMEIGTVEMMRIYRYFNHFKDAACINSVLRIRSAITKGDGYNIAQRQRSRVSTWNLYLIVLKAQQTRTVSVKYSVTIAISHNLQIFVQLTDFAISLIIETVNIL